MELAFSSACHLAALISRRQVGCQELLDYCIERIERLDGRLNAVVARDFDRARARARDVDNMIPLGPLHGVPMSVNARSRRPHHRAVSVSPR
jgi:amidase